MLHIPKYYGRNADQNDNKNQIPPVRMAIFTSRQIINVGESWEKREPPCMVSGNGHWRQSLERTASPSQKKKRKLSRKLSLDIDFPHMNLNPEKIIIQKDTCTLMFTAILLPVAKTQTQ